MYKRQGAREWDAYTPPGERRQGFDYFLSYGACDDHLDPHYWLNDETQIRPGKWSAEYETDKAIEYMDQKKDADEPFALFVSYNPPHLPYELVPERYYEKFKDLKVHYRPNVPESMREEGGLLETQTRQYLAAVHGIDEQFGRILTWLKENGMEENTLVVLSADHGEMLGSHGLMSKNIWYRRFTFRSFSGRREDWSPERMRRSSQVPTTCRRFWSFWIWRCRRRARVTATQEA